MDPSSIKNDEEVLKKIIKALMETIEKLTDIRQCILPTLQSEIESAFPHLQSRIQKDRSTHSIALLDFIRNDELMDALSVSIMFSF